MEDKVKNRIAFHFFELFYRFQKDRQWLPQWSDENNLLLTLIYEVEKRLHQTHPEWFLTDENGYPVFQMEYDNSLSYESFCPPQRDLLFWQLQRRIRRCECSLTVLGHQSVILPSKRLLFTYRHKNFIDAYFWVGWKVTAESLVAYRQWRECRSVGAKFDWEQIPRQVFIALYDNKEWILTTSLDVFYRRIRRAIRSKVRN